MSSFAFPFLDLELPLRERAADLVSRLTLEEKAQQMLHEAPAIERLGVPAYNYWNEGLHGVARAGVATVFPQAIGLAAMFDAERLFAIAQVIATEARAKHHEFARRGDRDIYHGLTIWSPNINIFRDPRWGRGHETYGECPHLTSRLGVAFCTGLQGDDPKYLAVVATPKHFAVHSGPEALRHGFDARVTEKDLRETYLPAFHACITEARAASIMSAYNRTNGEPCSGSPTLLARILRHEWRFEGFVVSDCWAIRDFHEHHGVTRTPEESAALAVRSGCDLNCGCTYEHLPGAVRAGLLEERELDAALERVFTARLRLGLFDPPERVPFAQVPYEANDTPEHRALSRDAARASLVLLKNDGTLPLRKNLRTLAVIGPNANDDAVLLGNYHGLPSESVTPLEAIRATVSPQTRVSYTRGCERQGLRATGLGRNADLTEARILAERADAVVLCCGLSADIEGEQGDAGNSEAAGDKLDLQLPGLQPRLLEEVLAAGKPTVVVVIAGSPLDLRRAHEGAGAIVMAWYPGPEGGRALADVLFGDASPAGRLPVTFPNALEDLPPFTDYALRGRTYRYLEREPLYPFGYGLSYARFEYSSLTASAERWDGHGTLEVAVTLTNSGARAAEEVVQLYIQDLEASCTVPHHSLRGFRRLRLESGESRRVPFTLTPKDFSLIDEAGERQLEPGTFRIHVGGSQPDSRSAALTGTSPLSLSVEVTGARQRLPY